MDATSVEIGKPYIWRTLNYGDVAVHVAKFSPNGAVAVLSIDGGSDSTPANTFPELSDGIGYACLSALVKRPRRAGSRNGATAGALAKPSQRKSRTAHGPLTNPASMHVDI